MHLADALCLTPGVGLTSRLMDFMKLWSETLSAQMVNCVYQNISKYPLAMHWGSNAELKTMKIILLGPIWTSLGPPEPEGL